VDLPAGFGFIGIACVAQHEWFTSLREAGFTRTEALYIITRPAVETARLEWCAAQPDSGQLD
jgi:hypothetical protein